MLVATSSSIARAQSGIRLPLEGYYRPGRCMPVVVEPGGDQAKLEARALVPIDLPPGTTGIVPALVLGDGTFGLDGIGLRALTPQQRLILDASAAPAGDVSELAEALFPGCQIVRVPLPAEVALSGPMLAWQSVDAVILEHLAEGFGFEDAIANRIAIVWRGDDPPQSRWPWRRVGRFWVLNPDLPGFDGAVGGQIAYSPLENWRPGQPPELRRRVVLVGVVVALLILLAAVLVRGRGGVLAITLVAIACAGSIEWWRARQPTLRRLQGQIRVVDGSLIQIDRWVYFASTTGGVGAMPVAGNTMPILIDPAHAGRVQLRMQVSPEGDLHWRFQLPPGSCLAFRSRQVSLHAATATAPAAAAPSPLDELARQMYLRAGWRILGTIPTDGDQQYIPACPVIGRAPPNRPAE
ncbi:hypothetical protein [Fontivita pretiosa]|uniref:hypothetical protein n=1 Tax=Fontivita pretiosa TaxID=2989684 RepID=UPI003D1853BD